MTRPQKLDRYLENRNGSWSYYRRVPDAVAKYEVRKYIRRSLKTTSHETARVRRDALADADEAYWHSLQVAEAAEESGIAIDLKVAKSRHKAACARAMMAGFEYRSMNDLTGSRDIEEIAARLFSLNEATGTGQPYREAEAEALLGTVKEPSPRVSEVFALYVDEIAFDAQKNKSPEQQKLWLNTKKRSISYFIDVIGDMQIDKIKRDHALSYRRFWQEKLHPERDDLKPMSSKTANRHIGDVRALYNDYYRHIGQEDRLNPFRSLSFKDKQNSKTPPFENNWVREKILAPGAFSSVLSEIPLIIFTMIETGARPSEIMNLDKGDICLNDEVPHINIRPKARREIKAQASQRKIPLVGVALEAMHRAPNGFTHYRDKSNTFSATTLKAMEERGLFPSADHVIYSFRHSFEKRMQEANIDFGLRCLLMGHKVDRPSYGDGGSLSYRRDELMKIVHPFSEQIFELFDDEVAESQ